MSLQAKLVSEFMKIGNVSPKNANAALQVYLELCEVKKYWDVKYNYHDELKQLYITAKKTKSENASIFVPRCSADDLTFSTLEDYFKLCQNNDVKSVFLALVNADSTCVYYQISEGLQKPVEGIAKHLKLNKQEKLDAAIRRHRNLLTEAALCGSLVTIRDPASHSRQQP